MNLSKKNFLGLVLIASAGVVSSLVRAQAPAVVERELPITEVVVYEDRALVTREAEISLQGAGVEVVLVGGLPPGLTETSLRAGLVDAARGRVISVASELVRKQEVQDEKLRAAEETQRSIERKISEIEDEVLVVATSEQYLGAYEQQALKAISERASGEGDPQTARWAEALKLIRDGRSAGLAARRDAERRLEELNASLLTAGTEVKRLRRPEERSVRTAEVAIETRGAGPTRLWLSYVIPGAGWAPRYDARHDAGTGELAVTYFGEVRQRTGEDWKAARLVLSTARPSVGASRPELLPVRLAAASVAPGGKQIAERDEAARTEALVEAGEGVIGMVSPAVAAAGGVPGTASRENATSAVFSVPGTVAIPSDSRPHKVPVTSFRERVTTTFETAPKLLRFVYLKAVARNASPFPMLAGQVDVYRGSGFIGTSRLKFVAPGRPFELSLGIEESLKVRRAVTTDAWSEDGREHRQGFDLEVENFGEAAATVTVLENYPVSEIEEVTVRLEGSTTESSEQDARAGILRWRLQLKPGESQRAHLEYTVRYPQRGAGSR